MESDRTVFVPMAVSMCGHGSQYNLGFVQSHFLPQPSLLVSGPGTEGGSDG